MRKIIVSILATALLLIGCSPSSTMSITPSKFSDETEAILNVIGGDDLQFFDISLDETAKSYEIIAYLCTDSSWQESGKIMGGVEDSNFQIAIEVTDTSFTIYSIDDNGHSKSHYPDIGIDFSSVLANGGAKLEVETDIVLNEEIPLLIKIGTDESSMAIYDINELFQVYDYEIGVAFTLKVSDKEVE